MVSKKYLYFAFLAVGGWLIALILGGLLHLSTGQPQGLNGWAVLLLVTPLLSVVTGQVFWVLWGSEWATQHTRLLTRLAEGDLTHQTQAGAGDQREARRLLFSLRRALSQVQRVTGNVRRT